MVFLSILFAPQARAQVYSEAPPDPTNSTDALTLGNLIEPGLRFELEEALKRKDYDKAEALLVREIEGNPSAPTFQLLCYLGGIFFGHQKYLNAAIAFRKAEAFESLDNPSRFTLAMSYILLGRRDWARPELEKLEQSAPDEPLYPYWLARVDFDDNNYQPAIERLLKLVGKYPAYVRAYDRLGLCYESLGKSDEAISYYRKAIELTKEEPSPWVWPSLNLGTYLIQLGRLEESVEYLQAAVRISPRMAQPHYRLGIAFEKLEKLTDSAESLKKAAELDPDSPDAYWALARVLRRSGDREGAARALEQYKEAKARADAKGNSAAPSGAESRNR